MPVPLQFDLLLGPAGAQQGYMLSRSPDVTPAWQRSGLPDVPERKSAEDVSYGNLPGTIDHAEVWDDLSQGAGYPVRRPDALNTYDFAVNADARFPGQLIHAVDLVALPSTYGTFHAGAAGFLAIPLPSVNAPPAGAGGVLVVEQGDVFPTAARVSRFVPTGLNTAASAFDAAVEYTVASNILHGQMGVFGSFGFIGSKTGSGALVRDMNGAYSASDVPVRFFLNAGSRFWLHRGVNELRNIANGANPLATGNWSATYNAGNGFFQQDASIDVFEQVFVGLADGLYAGDSSGTFANVLADLSDQRQVDNCRDLAGYQGGIMLPGGSGLWWFRPRDPVIAQEVGIPPNTSQVRGLYRAVANNGPWTVAGLFTGSQSHILVGRGTSNPYEGTTGYAWHHMHQLPQVSKVSRIFFDHITTPSGGGTANASVNTVRIPSRMWIATDATFPGGGTAAIYYANIANAFGNPLLDPTFTGNYAGSFRVDFGADDWGAPGVQKSYRMQEVWADSLLSGVRYADVYYTVDRATRTYLGRAQQSPVSYLPFPTGTINATDASFNPTLLGWEVVAGAAPVQQNYFASAQLSGNLYAFGSDFNNAGNTVWQPTAQQFALTTQTWATLPNMNGSFAYAGAAEASNGRVYVFGGASSTGVGPVGARATSYEYDPLGAAWANKTALPAARAAPAVCYAAANGRIYVFGGATGSNMNSPQSSTYEYNPAGDSFATKTAMPTARFGAAAATDGSFIYVAGGSDGSLALGVVERYDPVQDAWATAPGLPNGVMFGAGRRFTSGNGKVYVLGGCKSWRGIPALAADYSTLVQEYDPTLTAWTLRTPMSMPHAFFGAAEASGRLWAIDTIGTNLTERTVASLNTGFVTGQIAQISIESFTVSQNTTPVYRSFVLRGTMRPKAVDVVTAKVRAADNVPDRLGNPGRPGENILRELRSYASDPHPQILTDLTGATWYVAVQQPIGEVTVFQEGAENPEVVAEVKMSIMNFTSNPG